MLSCNNMRSADERISIKKEQFSSYLIHGIISLGKMTGKVKPFSWRSVEYELQSVFKYRICSSLDFEYRLWVILFTQERAPRQTLIYLKLTTETLKKVKINQS